MIDIIVNIALSVFVGIITYILIGILKSYFKKVIIPWYQSKIYKGLDISGVWQEVHNYENLITQESDINIVQKANSVSGQIILKKKNDNKKTLDVKTFRFSGEFCNNLLNISCWNENSKQVGAHNYLLKVSTDGRCLIGYKTFYDIGLDEIKSDKVLWSRDMKNE